MHATTNVLHLLLRKIETHAALDEEDRAAILSLPHKIRSLEAHSYAAREGDAPQVCAILIKGYAYRQKLTGDGARQIVALHIPGDPLDLQNLFLAEADHNVQTLTRADLAMIPCAALKELARARPAVARALTVMILVEASVFREWVLNIGRRDAPTRLAHLLCEFAARLDAQGLSDDNGYELPMTPEELGDSLGMTSVHVGRTTKILQTQGLVERGKGRIRFSDWKSMRDAADFTARYLHLEQQA